MEFLDSIRAFASPIGSHSPSTFRQILPVEGWKASHPRRVGGGSVISGGRVLSWIILKLGAAALHHAPRVIESGHESECREIALAKTKKTVRREWTKDDVRSLKTLAKQRAGVKKIAKVLKRTPGATMVKASLLGVSLDTRG
ncbi:hypothetical protein ABIB06_003713 [Bradyrhizobium sp. LB8.2]